MQSKKKTLPLPFIIFGMVVSVIIGYLIGGAWKDNTNLYVFLADFSKVIQSPFRNYFNQYTLGAICFSLVVYLFLMLLYYTGRRNYMPGREYGSAKFADAKEVTKKDTICLMSPAASSYEYFKNFEEKGRMYKEYVKNNDIG